jgi:hypothetical protein
MNQPKKGSIDDILPLAAESQTICFGEIHQEFHHEKVIPILSELKKQGYQDLAIETERKYQKTIDRYFAGKIDEEKIRHIYKSRISDWTPLIVKCKELGIRVHCIEINTPWYWPEKGFRENGEYVRDKKMYELLQERVFNQNPKAKVIYYGGARHVNEKPVIYEESPIVRPGKDITIAYYLNEYTEERNLSITLFKNDSTRVFCPFVDFEVVR